MKFRNLHPNVKFRIGMGFFQRLTQMSVFPFMAIYFSNHFGPKIAGGIVFISVLAALFSSFYGGYYSDLWGRKPVLLFSEKIRFITLLVMALCNIGSFSFPIITACMFILNTILTGISNPANEAMIVDVSTPETRKYIYNINYWATNLAIALGTMIGAFAYKYFFALVGTTSISSLVSYLLIKKYILETKYSSVENKPEKVNLFKIFGSYKTVFMDKVFLKFMIVSITILGLELQMSNYISVRLSTQFGSQSILPIFSQEVNGVQMWGILRMENTILVVLFSGILIKFTKKFSDRLMLFTGVVLFTGGFMVNAVSNIGWILLVSTLIYTIGELVWVPIHQSILAEIVKAAKSSQYMAVNGLRTRGALVLGSFGLTLGSFIPSWAMSLVYFIMGMICMFLYFTILNHLHSKVIETDQANQVSSL